MFQNLGYSTVLLGLAAAGQPDLSQESFPAAARNGAVPIHRPAGEEIPSRERIELAQASKPKIARAGTAPTRRPTDPVQGSSLTTNEAVLNGARVFIIHRSAALNNWHNNDDLTLRPSAAQKQKILSELRTALRLNDRADVSLQVSVKDGSVKINLEEPLPKGKRISSFTAAIPSDDKIAALKANPSKLHLTVDQQTTESKPVSRVSSSKVVAPSEKQPPSPIPLVPSREKIDSLPEPVRRYFKDRVLEGVGKLQLENETLHAAVFVGPNVDSELLHDFGVKWFKDKTTGTALPLFEHISPLGKVATFPVPLGVRAITIERAGEDLRIELIFVLPEPELPAKRNTLIIHADRRLDLELFVDIR